MEIYGAVGLNASTYTVQTDGGGSVTFNGTKSVLTPQTLLYQDNSLVPGRHEVKISNAASGVSTLSIDFAVIYGIPSTE